MPVLVSYLGLSGNQIFQYVYGRLFAEINGMAICTAPDSQLVDFVPPGQCYVDPGGDGIHIDDTSPYLLDHKSIDDKYVLSGYFQHAEWYVPFEKQIREFVIPKREAAPLNTKDIVMHVREGDYPHQFIIHPEWYLSILKHEQFEKLYIVCEHLSPQYERYFEGYDYQVVSGTMEHDWDFIRQFDRVLLSNSTYAWWAVFFGRASKIWVFEHWGSLDGKYDLSGWPTFTQVGGRMGFFETEIEYASSY